MFKNFKRLLIGSNLYLLEQDRVALDASKLAARECEILPLTLKMKGLVSIYSYFFFGKLVFLRLIF